MKFNTATNYALSIALASTMLASSIAFGKQKLGPDSIITAPKTIQNETMNRVYTALLQAKKDLDGGKDPKTVARNLAQAQYIIDGDLFNRFTRVSMDIPKDDMDAARILNSAIKSMCKDPSSALSVINAGIASADELLGNGNQPNLADNRQNPVENKEPVPVDNSKKNAPETKVPENQPNNPAPSNENKNEKANNGENLDVPIKITENGNNTKKDDGALDKGNAPNLDEKKTVPSNLTETEASQVAPLSKISERVASATTRQNMIDIARDFCGIVTAYDGISKKMESMAVVQLFKDEFMAIVTKAKEIAKRDKVPFNMEVYRECHDAIAKENDRLNAMKTETKPEVKNDTKVPKTKVPETKVPENKVPDKKTQDDEQNAEKRANMDNGYESLSGRIASKLGSPDLSLSDVSSLRSEINSMIKDAGAIKYGDLKQKLSSDLTGVNAAGDLVFSKAYDSAKSVLGSLVANSSKKDVDNAGMVLADLSSSVTAYGTADQKKKVEQLQNDFSKWKQDIWGTRYEGRY